MREHPGEVSFLVELVGESGTRMMIKVDGVLVTFGLAGYPHLVCELPEVEDFYAALGQAIGLARRNARRREEDPK